MVKKNVKVEVAEEKAEATKETKETKENFGLDTLYGLYNCKFCGGRGTVTTVTPHLNANLYRWLVPCKCVRRVIKWTP